ncbi:hypothetical protein [Paracraurococcus ruber]|uniref:Uncharacterized protein n=1 Tax=Paracraurococcus ruber TaxID=77675 RepID=A0ABS1CTB1_9PROT|nr:hypothetical protein [Paracraurococcus ruber]MBK1657560.1 hypothetical protein [Paracraurococcus ruber]TDG32078.1 hypothetical protein E2C05_08610 [Paracraurococcus ruber]
MPVATPVQIWFGTRAVDFTGAVSGTGQQVDSIASNDDFATRLLSGGTYDYTGSEWQQLLAFYGTATQQAALGINLANGVDTGDLNAVNTTGDLRVGSGVLAQNLADLIGGGRIGDISNLNQANDITAISGYGRTGTTAVGNALFDNLVPGQTGGAFVTFSNDLGFGLINRSGWDIGGNATRLNDGDSVNFNVAGPTSDKMLVSAAFTVRVLNGGSAEVFLDSDGRTIKYASGAFSQDGSAGELSLGVLADGAKVAIDYDLQTITINNIAFNGPGQAAFFSQFVINGMDDVTFGSKVVNASGTGTTATVGWSVDDLVLGTVTKVTPPPTPGLGVLSFDWFDSNAPFLDPAPSTLLDKRFYAYFDANGNNKIDAPTETATAQNMGQMRTGNAATDDPGDPGDDNPIQGAGTVKWLEMYALGAKNPAMANGQPIPSGYQYGEHIGGDVTKTIADSSGARFELSVNSARNPAEITPDGTDGGPLDVDPGQTGTLRDLGPGFINNGEILGFSLVKNAVGAASFASQAVITYGKGVDLTPGSDADIIVRLYNNSTLIETITKNIVNTVDAAGSYESDTFTVADNLLQTFNRIEIEAAGSMNGIVAADAGAKFVITDLDFFLV